MTTPGTSTEPDENGYFPTRDELDYAARKAQGFPGLGVPANQSRGVVTALQAPFAVEDNDTSAYVGVATEYMTYAEDLNKPLKAEGDADKDAEVAREEKLLEQTKTLLVAPAPEQPQANQTGGGGSLQETVGTALSGENFSSEVANPVETKQVSAEDSPTGVQGEVAEGGGSSGKTIGEDEQSRLEAQTGTSVEETPQTGVAPTNVTSEGVEKTTNTSPPRPKRSGSN